jgi:hypothetical protein
VNVPLIKLELRNLALPYCQENYNSHVVHHQLRTAFENIAALKIKHMIMVIVLLYYCVFVAV